MSDYNLSGLSTRSFEKLVQAIALKIIGPNVVIWGDGPDGGREATFDGPISYPSAQFNWNGYGVIQAKFRQRAKDKITDGDWALRQLRLELKKYSSTRSLRKPEYYIFATNVVLTPVNDAGWKDKALAVLQDYSRNISLKGFDIWDYDKIVAFLDGNEDIRHRYAAWITSGDVLSEMINWLKPSQPDFENTIHRFLQKELLTDQFAHLEQAGHVPEDHVQLASVFVDLPVSSKREDALTNDGLEDNRLPPGYVSNILAAARDRFALDEINVGAANNSGKSQGLKREPGRYVLIGGPGQGKTTIGQFICQLFRAAILRDRPEMMLSAEVRLALKEIYAQLIVEDLNLPSIRRFPIRIQLSRFASFLAAQDIADKGSLISYIIRLIEKRTNQTVAVKDFQSWLASYPWIIVLDGLDEVPASSNRDEILAAVRDFWIDASDCNADLMVIATTRPQGYNDDFSPRLYQHDWLTPLTPKRALHYAKRLIAARYVGNQERQERILHRLERASHDDATSRMMRSPLQVTIMATLVDRIGQPPQERWTLFNEYYDVIYKREVERDVPAADVLRNHRPDIDAIHSSVGLILQIECEQTGQTDARLSAARFADIVHWRLDREGHEGINLEQLKQAIMEAATSRLVFLVGLEADVIGFEIRSLQEYMAAEGLMSGDDLTIRSRLRQIAPIINWRNVFLFASGKCFSQRQHLRDIVLAICAELNEDPDDEVLHLVLAGSQLALELLEDGPARRQPKYTESLTRLAMRLLDIPNPEYPMRVAALYEPKLDRVYREELRRGELAGDPKECISRWACLLSLACKYSSWMELLTACWPLTADRQFDLLIIASTINRVSELANRFIETIPNLRPLIFYPDTSILYGLGSAEVTNQSKWIHSLPIALNPTKNASFRLSLPKMRGLPISFRPLTLGDNTLKHFTYLRDMPTENEEWLPLIAGARFACSPSAETLTSELRAIAKHYSSRSAQWLAPRVPWPLGACLASTDSASDLLLLAEKASSGDLGVAENWTSAEERWLASGINVSDVQYLTDDDRWPYDSQIDRHGFPFGGCDTAIHYDAVSPETCYLLLELHSSLKRSYMRGKVASWALLCLSALAEDAQTIQELLRHQCEHTDFGVTEVQLKVLITEARDYGVPLAALAFLPYVFQSTQEWIHLVDDLGRQYRLREGKAIPKSFVESLADAYSADQSLVGVLRVLSLLTRIGVSIDIPFETLEANLHKDSPEDAVMVALSQNNLGREQLLFLAQRVSELSHSLPDLPSAAIHVAQQSRTDSHFAEFVISLKKSLPSSQWQAIRYTLRFLNDSLRRRTSDLNKSEVWEYLMLPNGLNRL